MNRLATGSSNQPTYRALTSSRLSVRTTKRGITSCTSSRETSSVGRCDWSPAAADAIVDAFTFREHGRQSSPPHILFLGSQPCSIHLPNRVGLTALNAYSHSTGESRDSFAGPSWQDEATQHTLPEGACGSTRGRAVSLASSRCGRVSTLSRARGLEPDLKREQRPSITERVVEFRKTEPQTRQMRRPDATMLQHRHRRASTRVPVHLHCS